MAEEARVERTLRELVYVAIGVPLGAIYTALIVGSLTIGGVLGVVWLGLPLLLAASTAWWRLASIERTLANDLLRAQIPPLPPLAPDRDRTTWQRLRRRLREGPLWRAFALLALKLPVSMLAAAFVALGLGLTVSLVIVGVRGLAGSEHGFVGPFTMGPALGAALCVLAVPAAIVTAAIADVVAYALRALARSLLVARLPPGAPVRETLAQSLGDSSLSLAYWLPDREEFVDERGRPVPLPEHDSDRAWTAVDYDGRRVAAIIHDASLEAGPELVQAVAAAASLALDNERLKADLRARVEELRASRVRIVNASNSARRRIERDLHDGAQQQLVALAVELRLLRSRVGENSEALQLIDRLDEKLAAALDDLRELARGIHPGILSDRGLGPALESLASRAPLPVRCSVDLPERPAASVEAVSYFVINEALTNVLKYAEARHAVIRAFQQGDEIVVELQDDGVGGADERRGSGLVGLRDRVGALDGTLTVVSPPGQGTFVQAKIPLHAGELVAEATGWSRSGDPSGTDSRT